MPRHAGNRNLNTFLFTVSNPLVDLRNLFGKNRDFLAACFFWVPGCTITHEIYRHVAETVMNYFHCEEALTCAS